MTTLDGIGLTLMLGAIVIVPLGLRLVTPGGFGRQDLRCCAANVEAPS